MQREIPPDPRLADPLDLENWYFRLKDFTFETFFVPLFCNELTLICNVHDKKKPMAELDELRKRVEPLFSTSGKAFFVKLSTRSMKDWALRSERTRAIFQNERCRLYEELLGEDVRDVIAIIRAMSFALQVRSADEVLEMLVNSERSYQDCTRRALADNQFPMQLVFREWKPIRPELELRGFVFRKKLNGLSQVVF
jgi:hypothetical protein